MSAEWPRALLLAPVFLYLVALTLGVLHPVDAFVVLAAVATALPLVPWLAGRSVPATFAGAPAVLAIVGLLAFLAGAPPTGPAASLDVGVIVAAPVWFLAAALDSRREPGAALFAVIAGLALGTLLIATDRAMIGRSPSGPAAYLNALGGVLHTQASALLQILGGTTPAAIPLSQVADPVFALLAFLAGLGLIAPWMAGPAIDELRHRRLSVLESLAEGEAPPAPVRLPAEMDLELDAGTLPSEPPSPSLADAAPVLVAAGAALGFVVLAVQVPSYTLLVVAVVVAATFILVNWTVGGVARRAEPLIRAARARVQPFPPRPPGGRPPVPVRR